MKVKSHVPRQCPRCKALSSDCHYDIVLDQWSGTCKRHGLWREGEPIEPDVDEVAVLNAIDRGDFASLTLDERVAATAEWLRRGRSSRSLAKATGWNVNRYRRKIPTIH